MSQQVSGIIISRPAGADLRTKQFYAVKLSSDTVVLAGANDKDAIGILQNTPNTGEAASVQITGTSKVKVSEGVTQGDRGTPTGNGDIETVDAADEAYVCKFLESGSASDLVEALIERGESNTSDA